MKKNYFKKVIGFIVLALLISSCTKEEIIIEPDEQIIEPSEQILGIWNGSSLNYTGETVTEYPGGSHTITFIGEGNNIDFTYTFKENPNIAISNGSYDVKLTTTAFGETIIQNVEDLTFIQELNWSIDGDQLTTIQGDNTVVATIIKITDTVLELNIKKEISSTFSGVTETTTLDTYMNYTRQ